MLLDRRRALTGHAVAAHDDLQGLVEPSVDTRAALHVFLNYAATVEAVGGNVLRSIRRRLVETNNEQRTVYDADTLACQA